ncbi:MAG: hypothetical protein ABW172_08885 [Candidatus Binatia bacterium]|jgi:hypothetical protein
MEDRQTYVRTVLNLYGQMPAVGCRARRSDRNLAGGFFDREISIDIVEAALLLGSARWMCRRHRAPTLAAIRSLHYFEPIVEELAARPPPPGYIGYLRLKVQSTQIVSFTVSTNIR